jgi:hypothetical protein
MPLDHGRRLDQHHGVKSLWLYPVKPHPEEPVGGEEPKPTAACRRRTVALQTPRKWADRGVVKRLLAVASSRKAPPGEPESASALGLSLAMVLQSQCSILHRPRSPGRVLW